MSYELRVERGFEWGWMAICQVLRFGYLLCTEGLYKNFDGGSNTAITREHLASN